MTSSEHISLVQRSEEEHADTGETDNKPIRLTQVQETYYHRAATFLASFSVAVLLVLAITSFAISRSTKSAALFGFGFDALLDVGTSLVVLWRFYGSSQSVYSREKERSALLVLAFLFLAASLSVGIKSVIFIIKSSATEEILSLYVVAAVAVIISLMLFVSKLHVGHKLQSKTLVSDGYSSLACGIGALGVIMSAFVHSKNEEIYYLDAIVGLAIAALLMGYGLSLLLSNWKKPDSS